MKFNLPNILSLSRVFIAPLFLFFVLSGNKILISSSLFLFTIGAITDYFDGYLARKLNQTSAWGRFMDPLADKILTLSAFAAFAFMNIIPLWALLVIFVRDVSTTVLRIYGNKHGIEVKTSKTAKWKTFLQMFFIFYVLFLLFLINCDCMINKNSSIFNILNSNLTYSMIVFLVLYTVFTLIEYLFEFYQNIKKNV